MNGDNQSLESNLSEKQYLKLFFYVILPVLAVIAGMNLLFPTPDSEQYKGFYDLITLENPLGEGPADSHFEIGFSLTGTLFKLVLQTDYYIWIIFIVGLSLLIKFYVFQKFNNGYLVIILYLLTLYTSNECIVVRASIASSICMLGCLYLDKSKIKAFILFMLAISFHNSTCIFLLAVFIPQRFFLRTVSPSWFVFICITLIIVKEIIVQAVLALNIPRVAPYIFENPAYFNIWGLPRNIIAISSVYSLSRYIEPKELVHRYFLNLSLLFILISTIAFDFSLLSIRFLDLALPIILLLLLDKFNKRTKYTIGLMIILTVFELIFTRILGGPELILKFLKG